MSLTAACWAEWEGTGTGAAEDEADLDLPVPDRDEGFFGPGLPLADGFVS